VRVQCLERLVRALALGQSWLCSASRFVPAYCLLSVGLYKATSGPCMLAEGFSLRRPASIVPPPLQTHNIAIGYSYLWITSSVHCVVGIVVGTPSQIAPCMWGVPGVCFAVLLLLLPQLPLQLEVPGGRIVFFLCKAD
jgi:hypothetical protein